jgi:hypothetical protein
MNEKVTLWTGLIFGGLALAYGIYMLMYLQDAKKCDAKLSKRDRQFRQAAVVITWIEVVMTGLSCLGLLIAILAGASSPVSLGQEIAYTPMSPVSDAVDMSFY